jgi:hypothetical protein
MTKKATKKKPARALTARAYVIEVLRARENLPERERRLLERVKPEERGAAARMLAAVDDAGT